MIDDATWVEVPSGETHDGDADAFWDPENPAHDDGGVTKIPDGSNWTISNDGETDSSVDEDFAALLYARHIFARDDVFLQTITRGVFGTFIPDPDTEFAGSNNTLGGDDPRDD
ncbi:MAG: hypothetical protein AAF743_00655 [Planctomycetota bacterium]